MLLATYNFARFQNPFEFGSHYQLTNGLENQASFFALAKVVPAVYYLVFSPPSIGIHYPFVRPSDSLSAFASLPKGFSLGPTIGVLWIAPLALFGLMTPVVWWDRRIQSFVKFGSARFTIASLYISAMGMMAMFALLGWIVGRYLVDFAPELVLLSWLLLAALWQTVRGLSAWQSRLFQCAVAGFTLYSVFLDLTLPLG